MQIGYNQKVHSVQTQWLTIPIVLQAASREIKLYGKFTNVLLPFYIAFAPAEYPLESSPLSTEWIQTTSYSIHPVQSLNL